MTELEGRNREMTRLADEPDSPGIGKPDNVFEVHSSSTALSLDGKTHFRAVGIEEALARIACLYETFLSAPRLLIETIFVFGMLLVATLFFMPVFPSFVLIDWFDERELLPWLQGDQVTVQLARYFVLAFPASAVLMSTSRT